MLATEADVRSAIPNGDALASGVVSSLLAAADAAAKTYLQRVIESASYTERITADTSGLMFVKEYPITKVSQVGICQSAAFDVWNSGAARATVSVTETGLILHEFYSGSDVDNTLLFATYPTVSQLVAAIAALDRWDAVASSEVLGTEPTTELAELVGPMDCADSKHITFYLMDGVPPVRWDFPGGSFEFTECGQRDGETVLVKYTAGYATVPADITKAVAMIAAEMHAQDTASKGMQREKLGDYEYERFNPASTAVLTPTVQRLLNPWRRLVY